MGQASDSYGFYYALPPACLKPTRRLTSVRHLTADTWWKSGISQGGQHFRAKLSDDRFEPTCEFEFLAACARNERNAA